MNASDRRYAGYRFPPEIIGHAVWPYYRFCLSFRDAEDLLAQRGIAVSYETIGQWCLAFGQEYARGYGDDEAASVSPGISTSCS